MWNIPFLVVYKSYHVFCSPVEQLLKILDKPHSVYSFLCEQTATHSFIAPIALCVLSALVCKLQGEKNISISLCEPNTFVYPGNSSCHDLIILLHAYCAERAMMAHQVIPVQAACRWLQEREDRRPVSLSFMRIVFSKPFHRKLYRDRVVLGWISTEM